MNRDEFCISSVAMAAQSIRDTAGLPLCAIYGCPGALLAQLARMFACAHCAYDAHQVMLLHEATQAAEGLNLGLVLLDLCGALGLDAKQTQQALSLADWSEAQRLLGQEITAVEVAIMLT